jgi:hypothetical protein
VICKELKILQRKRVHQPLFFFFLTKKSDPEISQGKREKDHKGYYLHIFLKVTIFSFLNVHIFSHFQVWL